MRLILICDECKMWNEWDTNKLKRQTLHSYDFSNDGLTLNFTANISGVYDVQNTEFDESDLSIEDQAVEIKCNGCNSSITVSE